MMVHEFGTTPNVQFNQFMSCLGFRSINQDATNARLPDFFILFPVSSADRSAGMKAGSAE